jgi:hypothetical protein
MRVTAIGALPIRYDFRETQSRAPRQLGGYGQADGVHEELGTGGANAGPEVFEIDASVAVLNLRKSEVSSFNRIF